jgi:hypothetical protein
MTFQGYKSWAGLEANLFLCIGFKIGGGAITNHDVQVVKLAIRILHRETTLEYVPSVVGTVKGPPATSLAL